MSDPRHGQLLTLDIADSPAAWSAAGFEVDESIVQIDGIALRLLGDDAAVEDDSRRGIAGWALAGVVAEIDGLTTTRAASQPLAQMTSLHPNGVASIDHLVVRTDDFTRTLPAFDAAGIELRRTRTFDFDGAAQQQCFFWLGSTILELVGPKTPADAPSPRASFWGLAFTCPDLDESAARLGDLVTPVKPAVQRGRSISTLKTRDLDISVPIALMSPHVPSGGRVD